MKWWFAPAPAERLAALRILIGAFAVTYLLSRAPELFAIANLHRGSFEAIGVTRILHAPIAPWLAIAIDAATLVLCVLFTLGIRYRVIAPLTALALLWTLTYRNSWGQPFHTENLLVMHVIALAFTPAADVWALAPPRLRSLDHYGWPVKLLLAITVVTYVIAGTAKLRLAGSAWLDGEQLRNQIALDNARKVLFGAQPSFIARPFLSHPTWFTGFAIGTLIVELCAPIALLNQRIGRIWALTAWLFHVGVLALMHIVFPYPLVGVAFLPLLEPEKLISGISRRLRTVRPS